MDSKLIRFADGVEVEAFAKPGDARPMSSNVADKLQDRFESIQATLQKLCLPFRDTFSALTSGGGRAQFTKAEVELALSFTAEGNLFVTKAKGEAGLKVKLTLERDDGPKAKE